MNWNQIAGNWKQYKGQVRERWGKLTDDDLEVIRGKREQLVGKIQERYGLSIQAIERQIHEFFDALIRGDHDQEKEKAHHVN
jgi:uncharacterized protein YjbJ (UPF0337 family)